MGEHLKKPEQIILTIRSEIMSTTFKIFFFQGAQALQMTNLLTDLVVGLEEGQSVDQEASLEELAVDPAVEGQPSADLACVEDLAVPMAQQEGVDVGWP